MNLEGRLASFRRLLRSVGAASSARAMAMPLIATYRRPAIGVRMKWSLLALLGFTCLLFGYGFAANAPNLMLPYMVPPALMTVLLIWALPAGDYAPTRALSGFFWAFLVALVVWPNYLAVALPGLPWLTFLRLTGGPLAGLMLICLSVSRKFRQDLYEYISDAPLVWKSLAFYVLIATLTLPMSVKIGDTLNKYLLLQMNQICIFFVSCYVFAKPRRAEFWVYMLLALDASICLIGVWESRIGHVPWAGHIPGFLKIEDETVTRILAGGQRAATGIHRVASVQTTPLGLAELIGISTPFALHVAIARHPLIVRLGAAFCIPLFIYTIILTDARLGFVAILVAGALYMLLWALVRWREIRTSIVGPAIVLGYPVLFSALVASTLMIHKIKAKVWGDGSQAASNASRKEQWIMATPKIIKNPVGHGYGMAGHTLGFANASGGGTIDSYFLNLLLDTGVLGFIAYLTIFISAGLLGARTAMESPADRDLRLLMPLSVSLAGFIVVKGVLSQDANHPVVFMILGAIVALVHTAKVRARKSEGRAQAASGGPHG